MPNAHYHYCGLIPFEMYLQIETQFPRLGAWESDNDWLQRIKIHPNFRQMFFRPMFLNQIQTEAHLRAMRLAGARQIKRDASGNAVRDANGNVVHKTGFQMRGVAPGNMAAAISPNARDDFFANNRYKMAEEMYQSLVSSFDGTTPLNGSIFWNGINEAKLARLVDKWNFEHRDELFGQLEATTAVRYVNKQFAWDNGGTFQRYITDVSDKLGNAARGHVTSVVRCGMRDNSVFTTTELPRIMESMIREIRAKRAPVVTDITIVVIEPKHLEHRSVTSFTNNEITMIPIITKLPGPNFISGRKDCEITSHLDVNPIVRDYWRDRKPGPSAAALKIMKEFEPLTSF